jgi:hypothetical protein
MKTKNDKTDYQFGSVFEFKGEKYIFSHKFGPCYMLITMDGTDFDLFMPRQLTWLYQLPVKFYKGFDYVVTDDNLIIGQCGVKAVNFSDAEKSEILKRASDSPYFYLRLSYNRGSISLKDYRRIVSTCLQQHCINHKHEFLVSY